MLTQRSGSKMFIPNAEFHKAYQKIKSDALETHPAPSIIIFVAPTPDAICACRLFTVWLPAPHSLALVAVLQAWLPSDKYIVVFVQALLRYDYVAYEVRPVVGYDDVFTIKDEIAERGDAVCGACWQCPAHEAIG